MKNINVTNLSIKAADDHTSTPSNSNAILPEQLLSSLYDNSSSQGRFITLTDKGMDYLSKSFGRGTCDGIAGTVLEQKYSIKKYLRSIFHQMCQIFLKIDGNEN